MGTFSIITRKLYDAASARSGTSRRLIVSRTLRAALPHTGTITTVATAQVWGLR